ncbi:GNAT family N-acetyltransferase [Streptomyces sp. NPDC087908]|uniref:GNAT family N-acetyltransferase n=1 Tax=unclassified Streptomyces TaxID=2593676 RepID=UPI0011CE388A|nr:GNAT family N-acetyltransferase [Streptomyces sp. adm13(2018)]TXS26281.1 GNAT family N-acetyltransferase [Streptomyces sp. adm13(2018)]
MDIGPLALQQFTAPEDVSPQLGRELRDCWIEVTNAGGAAGFPFPPVDAGLVGPAVDSLVSGLDPATSRLLVATADGGLAGWLVVRRDDFRLVAHWGSLHHVQTRTGLRGRGVGAALVRRVREIARDEMGLEQLRLAARGGAGLETFYGRLGWREVGRWPGALRLAPGDDRDEVLMVLDPL